MSYLKNLYDLELRVHDHDVFSLWFSLCLNHITLWLMSWRGGQQAASSQHYLGHQLPNSMNGLHHITASFSACRNSPIKTLKRVEVCLAAVTYPVSNKKKIIKESILP